MRMKRKDKEFDNFFDNKFGELFKNLPECCPSDDFVDKVMVKCCEVEIKQPFNIFIWIREKHSQMVIEITTRIVNKLKNWVEIYYERVEMGVIPIHQD